MRKENDSYFTPPWMIHALLSHVPEINGRILEPCVGDGIIEREIQKARPGASFLTNDINLACEADLHFDATTFDFWAHAGDFEADWIITNPPFDAKVMVPLLERALQEARKGVILLGRISFLEPTQARGPLLCSDPPSRYLVTERHSFTGNGKSDSTTTAWMVWGKTPLTGRPIESLFGWK